MITYEIEKLKEGGWLGEVFHNGRFLCSIEGDSYESVEDEILNTYYKGNK